MTVDGTLVDLKAPLSSEPSKPPPEPEKQMSTLQFEEIGVWTVMREIKTKPPWTLPTRRLQAYKDEFVPMVLIVYQFFLECFNVSPWRMVLYLFHSLWSSMDSAVGLYFSSRLLNIIQEIITKQSVDGYVLATAVLSRIAFTFVSSVVLAAERRSEHILSTRIRYLFEERLLAAHLRLDLPTFEEPETAAKINRFFGRGSHGGGWEMLDDLVSKLKNFANVASQVLFLFGALRSQPGGYWFAIICLGKSIVDSVSYSSLWSETAYIWDSNPHYRRMRSLVNIATSANHRIEIITDGLVKYLQKEWKKARILLGDTSDDYPDSLKMISRPFHLTFLESFTEDFPLIFYACQVYLSPSSFSLTSVALMQQASSTLTWTFYAIFRDQKSFRQRVEEIKILSELGKMPNKLVDGDVRYPGDCSKHSSGMEVKFENVSFAYPKAENVIKNVSFTIGKGQTVVIVGINGSGKSTLLKLFNRLYDPPSGAISIDGTALQSFVASDVRQSMAMLFQNYSHYPISIRENILLGLPDMDDDDDDGGSSVEKRGEGEGEGEKRAMIRDDLVEEAARLGGSSDVIEKQPKGLDTTLKPYSYTWSTSSGDESKDFRDKMQEISKVADVSLGQWQRLALATHKHIKLVAVDEPSASLDPKMEYEIFERLRELSTAQGKTMIFVTHRFGHLTKRADLILVMQNGCLVEQGKHHELMETGGEYAKLYNLQAEGFLAEEEKK